MEEVHQTYKSMDGESAAGLDGFTGRFLFLHGMLLVRMSTTQSLVSSLVLSCLEVLATLVILLPKVQFHNNFLNSDHSACEILYQ